MKLILPSNGLKPWKLITDEGEDISSKLAVKSIKVEIAANTETTVQLNLALRGNDEVEVVFDKENIKVVKAIQDGQDQS